MRLSRDRCLMGCCGWLNPTVLWPIKCGSHSRPAGIPQTRQSQYIVACCQCTQQQQHYTGKRKSSDSLPFGGPYFHSVRFSGQQGVTWPNVEDLSLGRGGRQVHAVLVEEMLQGQVGRAFLKIEGIEGVLNKLSVRSVRRRRAVSSTLPDRVASTSAEYSSWFTWLTATPLASSSSAFVSLPNAKQRSNAESPRASAT
jgi:hypothetical protein